MIKKILVLKGDSYKAVGVMFERHGYDVLYGPENLSQANLVVFTGGSDVSPYIYGEEPHGARGCDPIRDELEKEIFIKCTLHNVPMIGICRGGQLLNVLNGGEMVQDHGLISGDVTCRSIGTWRGEDWDMILRVDHHQGIYPAQEMIIEAVKDHIADGTTTVYAGYYPDTKSLCFQPHPEWGHEPTEKYFFELVDKYIIKTEVANAA